MARRLILLFFGGVALLLVLIAATASALIGTSRGRSVLFALVEQRLGGSLDAEVEIVDGGGNWPQDAQIAAVRISQDGEEKIAVEGVRLAWAPLALLRGRIVVELAEAETIRISGPLASGARTAREDEERSFSLERPSLPYIELRKVRIGTLSLSEVLLGEAASFSADGRFAHTPDEEALQLRAFSRAGGDFADVNAYVAEDGSVEADVLISSDGGVVARLAGFTAPLAVDFSASGGVADWDGVLNGEFGQYGAAELALTGRRRPGTDVYVLAIEGSGRPGEAVPPETRNLLGETVDLTLRTAFERGLLAAEIDTLRTAAGELSGSARLRHRNGDPRAADLSFEIDPDDRFATDAAPAALFAPWALEAGAERRAGRFSGPGWRGSLSLRNRAARLEAADVRVGDDGAVGASLTARFAEGVYTSGALATAFGRGADASLQARYDADGAIDLSDIRIEAGDASATGRVRYAEERIDAALVARAGAALIGAFVPDLQLSGPAQASATAVGPLDDLNATLRLDTPAGAVNAVQLTPATLEARVRGRPDDLAGDATLVSASSGIRGSTAFSWRGDRGEISRLVATGPDFSINGYAAAEADGAIRAKLEAAFQDDFSAPFAGPVTGAAALDIDRTQSGVLEATVSIDDLRTASIAASSIRLTANGPADAIEVSLAAPRIAAGVAVRDLDLAARIDTQSQSPSIVLSTFSAIVSDEALRLVSPATIRTGEQVVVENLVLSVNERGSAEASLVAGAERIAVTLNAAGLALPGLAAILDGRMSLDTAAARPGSGAITLTGLNDEYEIGVLAAELDWDGSALTLDIGLEAAGERRPFASVALPLARGATATDFSLGDTIEADALYEGPVEPLMSLTPPAPHIIEGDIRLSGGISGLLEAPVIDIAYALNDGRYENAEIGAVLNSLSARGDAVGEPETLVLSVQASAAGARGGDAEAITGSATIDLGAENLSATLALREAALVSSSDVVAVASGRLSVEGPLNAPGIDGRLVVNRLDAQIPKGVASNLVEVDVVRTDVPQEEIAAMRRARGGPLDLDIVAREAVYIRGRGLDTEWSADVTVGGTTVEPTLTGSLNIRQGSLTFAGRRFDITEGEVAFSAIAGLDPTLNIRAEYEAEDDVTAIISVTGRSSSPSIELSAIPTQPDEDVMAYVLFGKPARELTETEALQIAFALAQLAAVGPLGGSGFTDKLRRSFGLDQFSVAAGEDAASSSLTVGKYVADGVFLSATQDLAGENAALVLDIELTDRIGLKTELRQSGGQRASINYKRDF
ncbi:MAG: translocation/assembly module TamB domain-containing protein [Pseudomonadota bacterium]